MFLQILLACAVQTVYCVQNCKELPVFSPSPLVVKHGDPAIATCSICNNDSSCDYELRLEEPFQASVKKGNQMLWNVPNMTEWSLQIYCFIFDTSCTTSLEVIVYQPPEKVSVSFRKHSGRLLENPSGPLEEDQLYCLQCEVEAVAPAQNMTVAFYRGLTELSVMRSSATDKRPVNVNLCLNHTVSRQDHGATFWCEARLELGPEGPQPPPVVRSHNITANVLYAPCCEGQEEPQILTVAQGASVDLVCSTQGNPQPLYSWSHPLVSGFRGDVLTIPSASSQHEGPYTCTASNALGAITRSFTLRVHVDYVPIIITVVIAVVLLLGAVVAFVVYKAFYKPHRTGHYHISNMFRLQRHDAVPTTE
ncbi:intercellular adhesion molecule 3-like [Periophthalmus magnuspinnatus]|uniref:intercellular adhesion molecule 3-like n=1 Tax=Periophthalmus magnuspinnatus TaxID=409849 RepID=UPI002436DE85|nr:intercellular adhesion molecule 3-like [Periophthalmus magnuspinnatus]